MNLYEYSFDGKKGLILESNVSFGEIAPLKGFSLESFEEAKEEAIQVLEKKKKPTLPSVRFGFSTAQKPLESIRVPLAALKRPREGCPFLKLKLKDFEVDQAVSFVKEYLGQYRLRLDCNRAWSLEEAVYFVNHFTPKDFDYLEEPLKNPKELTIFSEKTKFPIALDETYRESPTFRVPTLKAIVIKPTLSGSIPSLDVPIILSSSYESSIGLLQIASLADPKLTHGLDTFQNDFLKTPLKVVNGHLVWKKEKNPIHFERLCLIQSVP